jgi:hypothetical protein
MDTVRSRRWRARVSLALAVLAVVVLLSVAGRRSVWLLLMTAAAGVVVVAAGLWFLQQRGVLRWGALDIGGAAPVDDEARAQLAGCGAASSAVDCRTRHRAGREDLRAGHRARRGHHEPAARGPRHEVLNDAVTRL